MRELNSLYNSTTIASLVSCACYIHICSPFHLPLAHPLRRATGGDLMRQQRYGSNNTLAAAVVALNDDGLLVLHNSPVEDPRQGTMLLVMGSRAMRVRRLSLHSFLRSSSSSSSSSTRASASGSSAGSS
mmetsp:Transcript_42502/g.68493  ORF Transcript_42502/g.68493 Transcript_42502/m.68493 type:complete len:129 (-) Transcript_42502:634-1020(-)